MLALRYPDSPFLSAVARGEQSFQDLLRREGRETLTREDFVFIGIDQQSLQLDVLSDDEIAGSRPLQLMPSGLTRGHAKSGRCCSISCSGHARDL